MTPETEISTAALVLTTLFPFLSAFSSFVIVFSCPLCKNRAAASVFPPCHFQTYKYTSFVMLFLKSFSSR